MREQVTMNLKEYKKEWTDSVDLMFKTRNLHPDQHNTIILKTFYTTFLNDGLIAHMDYDDGFEMIDILCDNENLPEIPTENIRTTIYDVVPELKNNNTFREIAGRLTNVKMKGIGVGEIILHLLYKDSDFTTKHDFVVSGSHGEIKNLTTGGCLKATKDTQYRKVDITIKKYFDNHNFFQLQKSGRKYYEEQDRLFLENQDWWVEHGSIEKARGYFEEVYPQLSEDSHNILSELFVNNVENPRKLNSVIGREVYKLYNSIDGFDFLSLVKPSKNLDVIFILDVDDEDFITENVNFFVSGRRAGDSNAVGDGYAVIKGINK
jgi:hypothetical protein